MADNDALDRLSKKLDGGSAHDGVRRSPLYSSGTHAPEAWREESPPKTFMRSVKRLSGLELLFRGSIVFFIVALAIAGLLFFSGSNTISTKNVDVEVSGPTEIGAGNTLSLQIVVTNRNAVPMELTDLIVEFPPGTRSDSDVSVDLPRIRQSVGTIQPGESINRTVRAVVFGEAGSSVSIKASVEYHVPSSNAVFVSDTAYVATINQAPASINIDILKEAVSGQEVSFTVSLTSNAPQVLGGMLLLAQYPPGFSFESSDPAPASGSAAWDVGDIEPGGTRTITIKGIFTGEDGATRVIHFTGGNRKTGGDYVISAPLATSDATLTVTKPFVSIQLLVNGTSATEHTVDRGAKITGQVQWTNNLPVKVENVKIRLSFAGQILDQKTVSADKGFFSSSDNTILWSKATDPRLADVQPGVSESLNFAFATLPANVGSYKNPQITLGVNVGAERLSETNVPDTVTSSAATNVLVASDLGLVAALTPVSGPLPPKANKETVLNVTWTVSNTANALANVSASGVLPSYVRFITSSDPDITFDAASFVVTWAAGDLLANQSKTGVFQVGITPSLSQVGTAPSVVGDQRISGYDRFVRGQIENTTAPLTTASIVSSGGGIVVP